MTPKISVYKKEDLNTFLEIIRVYLQLSILGLTAVFLAILCLIYFIAFSKF